MPVSVADLVNTLLSKVLRAVTCVLLVNLHPRMRAMLVLYVKLAVMLRILVKMHVWIVPWVDTVIQAKLLVQIVHWVNTTLIRALVLVIIVLLGTMPPKLE